MSAGTTLDTGHFYESLACEYLQTKGLQLLEKNFRGRCGELDIIMQDRSQLVFVEVRYRKSEQYGTAAESVTAAKQQKLQRTAMEYLQNNRKMQRLASRFDVVTITGLPPRQTINWIPHAFEC